MRSCDLVPIGEAGQRRSSSLRTTRLAGGRLHPVGAHFRGLAQRGALSDGGRDIGMGAHSGEGLQAGAGVKGVERPRILDTAQQRALAR
jgi:hypothetical protein